MQFLAKLMRLIGVSQIHTGTAVGKLTGTKKEVALLADVLRERHVNAVPRVLLDQDWGHIRSAFPVSSGGLHPGIVPEVLDIYGCDLVLLVSGGIHGHPDGTRAGAIATMQAIEAWKEGVTLDERAKNSRELARALEKWGVPAAEVKRDGQIFSLRQEKGPGEFLSPGTCIGDGEVPIPGPETGPFGPPTSGTGTWCG